MLSQRIPSLKKRQKYLSRGKCCYLSSCIIATIWGGGGIKLRQRRKRRGGANREAIIFFVADNCQRVLNRNVCCLWLPLSISLFLLLVKTNRLWSKLFRVKNSFLDFLVLFTFRSFYLLSHTSFVISWNRERFCILVATYLRFQQRTLNVN